MPASAQRGAVWSIFFIAIPAIAVYVVDVVRSHNVLGNLAGPAGALLHRTRLTAEKPLRIKWQRRGHPPNAMGCRLGPRSDGTGIVETDRIRSVVSLIPLTFH